MNFKLDWRIVRTGQILAFSITPPRRQYLQAWEFPWEN